jgi:hypothetical protein
MIFILKVQYDYHNFNGKKGLYAFLPSKNLNELHINFFLAFVSESMVPATVLLLQHYNFIKDLEARNVE